MKIPFISKSDFFTAAEQRQIVEAIRDAERQTSGEIRLYVESRCRYVEPLDRATEVFWALRMDQTQARNGVLVYVAIRDRQLAILGDRGIHEKVGETYWKKATEKILVMMKRESYADAIARIIREIGEALKTHFPFDGETDRNELPDDIAYGR